MPPDQDRHHGLFGVLLHRRGVLEPQDRELGQLLDRFILILRLFRFRLFALCELRVDQDAPHAALRRGDERVPAARRPARAANVRIALQPSRRLSLVLPSGAGVLVVSLQPHLRRRNRRRRRRRQGLWRVLDQEHTAERRDDRRVAGVYRPAHDAPSLVAREQQSVVG